MSKITMETERNDVSVKPTVCNLTLTSSPLSTASVGDSGMSTSTAQRSPHMSTEGSRLLHSPELEAQTPTPVSTEHVFTLRFRWI